MTRKGRDAKAAWTGAETEASRRDKELPAAAKPGPPSQCDSMVGYDGYCYTHKRAGEDCQTIRALEARVKELEAELNALRRSLSAEGWEAWERERRAALREKR